MSLLKNTMGPLQTSLISKPYSLKKTFIKTFNKGNGFCDFNFGFRDGSSTKGIALIDTDLEPPVRIMNYGDELFSRDYIRKSLKRAMEYREKLSNDKILDIGSNSAYRLVNDGSDGLSGLTVDVFADYLQITTYSEHWHAHVRYISEYLLNETGKKGIYWRNITKDQQTSKLYLGNGYELDENNQSTLVIEENGMKSFIDLLNPKSTGYYLEHRENRQIISDLFKGRKSGSILNLFSHTSSFSIAPCVNGHKIQTFNIDDSKKNLRIAKRNFELNGLDLNFHKFIKTDVFTHLEYLKSKSTRFDVVVVDPPSRTSSNSGVFTIKDSYRGLLISTVFQLLNPGGFIAAFTNTRSISESKWLREIGVKNESLDDENNNGNKKSIDYSLKNDMDEISQHIKRAQFSDTTKNRTPFVRLRKFKAVQYFDQSPDFHVRKGDDCIPQLKGVLLKNKIDYSKTKYFTKKKK
ncbi:hypothetical protein ACTA71_012573 [Dictyostelium dimigraforme]